MGKDLDDNTSIDTPIDKDGNKILYIGTQEIVCRMMFFVTSFNFAYWSYYITNAWYYDGVTVTHMNIPLGGDPRWGFAGAFGTGLMVYFTKQFSDHAARRIYETSDGKRIGFQMHNIFGGIGRKIECSPDSVRLLKGHSLSNTLGSSNVPLRVKGVGKNVIIDRQGQYYYNNKLHAMLIETQAASKMMGSVDEDHFPVEVDSKEKRIEYMNKRKRGKRRK